MGLKRKGEHRRDLQIPTQKGNRPQLSLDDENHDEQRRELGKKQGPTTYLRRGGNGGNPWRTRPDSDVWDKGSCPRSRSNQYCHVLITSRVMEDIRWRPGLPKSCHITKTSH